MVTDEFVRSHFDNLFKGGQEGLLAQVADNCEFTVSGKGNPLHGHYSSKQEFIANYFGPLGSKVEGNIRRRVTDVIVSGKAGADAVIEFTSTGVGKKNGKEYVVEIVWLTRYEGEKLVWVKIYMDSATLRDAFAEN